MARALDESLIRMSSVEVDRHAGKEIPSMYHCTNIAAAKKIVQSQAFWGGKHPNRSGADMVGPGVYLSKDRNKAERYRDPQGSGPVLMCRVKLGECIELRDQPNGSEDPLMKTWCVSD